MDWNNIFYQYILEWTSCHYCRYPCQCWSRNFWLRTCGSFCCSTVSSNQLWNSCHLHLGGKLWRQEKQLHQLLHGGSQDHLQQHEHFTTWLSAVCPRNLYVHICVL